MTRSAAMSGSDHSSPPPFGVDSHILTDHETDFTQSLTERTNPLVSSTPITGIADCCARAASGHAAAPPSGALMVRRCGTCVSSHAPSPDPYVRLSRIRLVWGFRCQGLSRLFAVVCFILLFDPRREHSSVPDRILASPSRAATIKDGAPSAPPKACP